MSGLFAPLFKGWIWKFLILPAFVKQYSIWSLCLYVGKDRMYSAIPVFVFHRWYDDKLKQVLYHSVPLQLRYCAMIAQTVFPIPYCIAVKVFHNYYVWIISLLYLIRIFTFLNHTNAGAKLGYFLEFRAKFSIAIQTYNSHQYSPFSCCQDFKGSSIHIYL